MNKWKEVWGGVTNRDCVLKSVSVVDCEGTATLHSYQNIHLRYSIPAFPAVGWTLFLCQAYEKSVDYNSNVNTFPELWFFLGRRLNIQQLNASSSSLLIRSTQNVLSFKLAEYFKYLLQGVRMSVHLHSSPDLCVAMSVRGPCFDKMIRLIRMHETFVRLRILTYSQFCNHCAYQYWMKTELVKNWV